MIQNFNQVKEIVSTRFSQTKSRLKKELTRIKLRRRGSFAGSTWLSLAMRPLLEAARLKSAFGLQLAAAMLVLGVSQANINDSIESLAKPGEAQEVLALELPQENIDEETTYLLPVEDLTGISQYFHAGHPGIDLRSPLESSVVSIENGVVKQIIDGKFGYGRHLYIDHGNGFETLYAHLGLIMVEEGEEVRAGDKIAEIGLTGWSTGSHLHFEVLRNGSRVNPYPYLYKSLRMWKESLEEKN